VRPIVIAGLVFALGFLVTVLVFVLGFLGSQPDPEGAPREPLIVVGKDQIVNERAILLRKLQRGQVRAHRERQAVDHMRKGF
jgi:hypothetical protein